MSAVESNAVRDDGVTGGSKSRNPPTGKGSHDPGVRLAHLHDERRRLDDEIARVQLDGVTTRYEPSAVRERFVMAVALLKELLADFRAVEDRFKEITRPVQQRQVDGKDSRGSILEYALDAEYVPSGA